MVATQRLRSISPPFSKKIRLTTLGKRGERFARLVGLQTLAEQRAFPADLSGDLVHLAHQRFGLAQRAGRPFGKSLGGLSSPGAQIRCRHHGVGQPAGQCGGCIERFSERKHRVGADVPDPGRQ